ncbi:P1 family peptidase, partial [Streptomyces durbertensis]
VRVGPAEHQVVPVVPAACLFDLGRGGEWRARPDAALGRAAAESAGRGGDERREGNVGAGTGAVVGGLKGGVAGASTVLASGVTVAAIAAVNAVGSVLAPDTGALYGELYGAGRPLLPSAERHERALHRLAQARETSGPPPLNTTLAVVATDASLGKAQAQKMAGTAHDGLARAVSPVHLLHDGDTVFAMATGTRPVTGDLPGGGESRREAAEMNALNQVYAAGADVLTRAVVKAVLAAETVNGPGGHFPSYRDLYDRR